MKDFPLKEWAHTDIVTVKQDIKMGRLEVAFYNSNILLRDTRTGEAVKIGELPKEEQHE